MTDQGSVDKRDEHLATDLEDLKGAWEAYGDLHDLRQAVAICRYRPLPEWLYEVLFEYLTDAMTTPAEKQKQAMRSIATRMIWAVREAYYGDRSFPVFYKTDDEKPTEKHYRAAAERLNAEGVACTPQGVKKAWQRHGPLTREASLTQLIKELPTT